MPSSKLTFIEEADTGMIRVIDRDTGDERESVPLQYGSVRSLLSKYKGDAGLRLFAAWCPMRIQSR